MAVPPSPAHRAMKPFASDFDNDDELRKPQPMLQKKDSKLGRWLSHVHDRLVMRLVCCAPASVVLEVEFEDENFCRPEDTEIRKIEPAAASFSSQLKKQKSASIAPVLRSASRGPSDRDIPTNEELERLPIDLSFVLDNNNDDTTTTALPPSRFSPAPPATPRHAALMQRAQQIAAFRQQRSARMIQRQWRQTHSNKSLATDVEDDGDKTDLETDAEQDNSSTDRPTKSRRRRIRKHRGRKKKHN
jgi:hypothetical protein